MAKTPSPVPDTPFGWKTVWVLSMFDLPTETKEQRRAYTRFRKDLLDDGFTMMQVPGLPAALRQQRECTGPYQAHGHAAADRG